jgi:hypothetical protein
VVNGKEPETSGAETIADIALVRDLIIAARR